jgi:hypothetical protein
MRLCALLGAVAFLLAGLALDHGETKRPPVFLNHFFIVGYKPWLEGTPRQPLLSEHGIEILRPPSPFEPDVLDEVPFPAHPQPFE